MDKEGLIAAYVLLCGSLTAGYIHSGTYHAGNNLYCDLCPPGNYLHKNCTTTNPAPVCQPCKTGIEFQPDWNSATTCASCSSCNSDSRLETKENCTTTADIVCQCKAGYYKKSETGGKFVCLEITKCKPGYGLMHPGDRENNNDCKICINGSTYWESSTKPCQSCKNCSTELCKPYCMPANPVTTEKTAGLTDSEIGVIIGLIILVVAVVVVLIVLRHCKKGPKCLPDCWYGQSSTSDQENPPERDQFLPNDETDRDAQRSNQSPSQVSVSAQQTDGIPITLLKKLSNDLISREWQFFFRSLFPDGSNVDKEINRVQMDYQNNVAEQIYQMLLIWKQKEGCRATIERIVDVMRIENMQSLVDIYQDSCQAPSQPNGSVSNPRANGHSIDVLPTAPPANDVEDNSGDANDSTGPGPVSENGHIGRNGTL